jgi:hypothetical protein
MTGSHVEEDVLCRWAPGTDERRDLLGGAEMSRGLNLRFCSFLPQLVLHPFDDLGQDFACLALD